MCLTLQNAVAALDHLDGRTPATGYTRTRHHIGHLGPGDWWFPGPDPLPHTVTGVHRRAGRVVLTDQYGTSYSHPRDAVISTAVPDPRILAGARGSRGADDVTRRPGRDRLDTRQVIDRAMAAVMARQVMTEQQAFRWLQRAAMDHRTSIRAVADRVLGQQAPVTTSAAHQHPLRSITRGGLE